MRAHLRLMRRVLAPLRRCLFDDGRRTRLRRSFADDDRRTRLRALYEDAALVRGSDAAVVGETDPTTVIADRKIADAARRGVFDKLDGQGAPLKAQPHRSAALGPAQRAGAEIAGVLAAQNVAPPSIDLRRRVDEGLAALRARIRAGTPRSELEADAAALNALVERQRHAAIGDAEAFGTRAFECPRVDLAAELVAAGRGAG